MKLQHAVFDFRLLPVIVGLAVLAGCAATPPSGQWQVDQGVQKIFEEGKVLPDHTYYYLGSIANPSSILAIDNHFKLRTRVWAQVDMTESVLNGWLSMFKTENATGCDYYGGVVLTPDGQRAGVWYSQNIINIIEMPEPGVVDVYQPHTPSGATCGGPDNGMYDGGRL